MPARPTRPLRLSDLQSGAPSPGSGMGGASPSDVRAAFTRNARAAGAPLFQDAPEPAAPSEPDNAPLSVSEALGIAKGRLDGLPKLEVAGEVTGFRGPNARSGHCYFQVKDDSSAMDVIVWRGVHEASGVELRDGLRVQMSGKFDVYLGTGRMSFICRRLRVAGEGQLRQQVAELARKLEREGLMAQERKRAIPRFCTRVAVVTSLSGSVIDDVKRTLRRRNPLVELLVVGAQVQGPGAPESLMAALVTAAKARPDCVLLVRGGGSFEDLMTFNDEALARAVAACPVPVVTGIGHEPDTCICDMVADRRTSTPTAAAESVAPAIDEIANTIETRAERLAQALTKCLESRRATQQALGDRLREAQRSQLARERLRLDALGDRAREAERGRLGRERVRLDALAGRRCLQDADFFVASREAQLAQTEQRLHDALPRLLDTQQRALAGQAERLSGTGKRMLRPFADAVAAGAATLDALSPLKVLGRGYAIARDEQGHVISNASQVDRGAQITVRVASGTLEARVTGKEES